MALVDRDQPEQFMPVKEWRGHAGAGRLRRMPARRTTELCRMRKQEKRRTRRRDAASTTALVGLVVLIGMVGLLFSGATKDVTLIKSLIFYWAVTVMFLLLMGVGLIRGEILIPRSKMVLPLTIYLGLYLISMLFSRYRYAGAQEMIGLLCCGMLVLVTARGVTDERSLLWVMGAIAVVGALSSVYGIAQHGGVDPVFQGRLPWEEGRSFSTMGHPNFYASFLVLSVPVLLSLFFWSKNSLVKGVLVPLICAMVLSLFYTSSRGAWLGYLASLPVWFFLSIVNKRLRLILLGPILCVVAVMVWLLLSGRGGGYLILAALPFWLAAHLVLQLSAGGRAACGRAVWTAILLGAVVLVSAALVDRGAFGGRMDAAYETEKGSVRTRKILWTATLEMIRARPVFGWGVGTFGIHFPRFRDPSKAGKIAPNTLHAHSEYLEIAAEVGVIGLAVFLWMLAVFGWEAVRRVLGAGNELQRAAIVGCLAGSIAILVHATVSVTTRWVIGRFFLWLGIGLTIAAGNMGPSMERVRDRKKKDGAGGEESAKFYRLRVRPLRSPAAWTVFVVLSLGAAVATGVLAGRVFQSAALTKKGEDYQEAAEAAAREKGAEADFRETSQRERALRKKTISLHEEAIDLNPYNLSAYYKLGHCYNLQGEFEEALRTYRRMQELSPDASDIHYNLGVVYGNMGRWEKSRGELIQGLRMKVGPLTRLALARAYTNLGQFEKAEEQYKLLMEERPADTRGVNGLANLYVRQGKNAKAAELYSKALEIEPEDADARLGMGLLYQVLASQRKAEGNDDAALGCYRRSVLELERAVEARPAGVPGRAALALVYAEVGRFEDALGQSRTALKIDPQSALAHLNLGKVFRKKGDFERAKEAFSTVKRLDERGPWGAEAIRELKRLGVE